MAGMEVNAGEAFDTEGRTIVQLITWLQSQDQNSHVNLDGGGTLRFRRLRAKDGGGIQVEVTHEKPKPRPKSKSEKALEEAGVSKTDSPAEAQKITKDAERQTGPGGKTKHSDDEDSILENEGKDQGGVVPGTGKTGSEKSK